MLNRGSVKIKTPNKNKRLDSYSNVPVDPETVFRELEEDGQMTFQQKRIAKLMSDGLKHDTIELDQNCGPYFPQRILEINQMLREEHTPFRIIKIDGGYILEAYKR